MGYARRYYIGAYCNLGEIFNKKEKEGLQLVWYFHNWIALIIIGLAILISFFVKSNTKIAKVADFLCLGAGRMLKREYLLGLFLVVAAPLYLLFMNYFLKGYGLIGQVITFAVFAFFSLKVVILTPEKEKAVTVQQ